MLKGDDDAVTVDELLGLGAGEVHARAHGDDGRAGRTVLVLRAQKTRVESLLGASVIWRRDGSEQRQTSG